MKKSIIWIIVVFIIGFYIFLKLIDFEIADLGRSLAPDEKSWKKADISLGMQHEDIFICGNNYEKNYQKNINFAFNIFDLCMIKKGYEFLPRGDGNYLNWCDGSRDKTVACLFYDGKIILNQQGQVVWKKTGAEVRIDEEGIVK